MKIFEYFNHHYPGIGSIGEITWSHAVNSEAKADMYVDNPDIMFIESDVRMSDNGQIVMAHPPSNSSDLTYVELVQRMVTSKQGLKLDFKDPETLIPGLEFLQMVNLKQPVMINADILQARGGPQPKFSALEFIVSALKLYPHGILSLGWTTTPDSEYDKESVDEIIKLCDEINLEITYPVRACLLPKSWQELKRLLEKENTTLTIWNNEPVNKELQDWIKNNTDPSKVFYDFIDENKDPIRFW